MKVLVLGATGGTGRLIVGEALRAGHEATVLVRSEQSAAPLAGARVVQGDARDAGAVARALEGCDAAISSLGTGASPIRRVTLLSEATAVLVEAMRRQGARRLVCITGLGAGDSRGHGGFIYERIITPLLLRNVYADKNRQEGIVRDSGLDWTLVRPSVLNDKPARGAVRAITDLTGFNGGEIARADVARFVVAQLTDDAWLRKAPLITW